MPPRSAPGIKAIAVLHPRKLTIFTVEAIGGQGSKVTHFNLKKAYEHTLGVEGGHFTAYNMTYGEFGGVSRDLLCVQSLDGRLQVATIDHCTSGTRLELIYSRLRPSNAQQKAVSLTRGHCNDKYFPL